MALEQKHRSALATMQKLIEEQDVATGHAFIIFHKEVDRNKMYLRLIDPATRPRLQSEAWPRLPYEPPEESVLPACMSCCVPGQKKRPPELEARPAPEPDAILWENLQLTDEWESKVERWGYTTLGCVMLFGLLLLAGVKLTSVSFKKTLAENPETAGTSVETGVNLVMAVAVSGTTIVFNTVLKKLIFFITKKEGQDTITQEQASIFSKLSVAFVMNTALVPLVMVTWFSGSDKGDGHLIDQTWFETDGLIQPTFLLLIINWAGDVTKAINPAPIINRRLIARLTFSQAKLDKVFEPPPFDLGLLYSQAVKSVALGLVFGPLYPIAYLLTAVGLLLCWFCTRVGMRYWFRKPPNVDQEMMMELRLRLGNVMGIATAVQCIATYYAMGEGGFDAAGVLLVGAPLVCVLYAAYPLERLPWYGEMFKRAEQIEEPDAGEHPTGAQCHHHAPPQLTIHQHPLIQFLSTRLRAPQASHPANESLAPRRGRRAR